MEKYYIEKSRRESNYIMEIQQILEWYCDNEMYRLKKICYPMLIKIGGISDKDYDDFYSIALSVLSDTALRFDSEKEIDFDSFLASNIKRKFKTEIRDRNREKRIPAKKLESTSNLVTEDGLNLEKPFRQSLIHMKLLVNICLKVLRSKDIWISYHIHNAKSFRCYLMDIKQKKSENYYI